MNQPKKLYNGSKKLAEKQRLIESLQKQLSSEQAVLEEPVSTDGIDLDVAGQINIDIDFSAGTSQEHEEALIQDENELQKQIEQTVNESTKEAIQWEQKIVEAMAKNKVDPARIRREWLQPTLPYPLLKYEASTIAKKIQATDKVPVYEGNINKSDDAQLIVDS